MHVTIALLALVAGQTVPLTTHPLEGTLTLERLALGLDGGQVDVPYHAQNFALDRGDKASDLEGTIHIVFNDMMTVNVTSSTQYVVNYWPSSLWPTRFTSDDPSSPVFARKTYSPYETEFMTHGGEIVNRNNSRYGTSNEFWDYINTGGRCRKIEHEDEDVTLCRFHFIYEERNENCEYNAMVLVLFDESKHVLGAYASTALSLCGYYQTYMFGFVEAVYTPHRIDDRATVLSDFNDWVNTRVKIKDVRDALPKVYDKQDKGPAPPFDLENNAWNDPSFPAYTSAWNYTFRIQDYDIYYYDKMYSGPTESNIGRLPPDVALYMGYPDYSKNKARYASLTLAAIDQEYGSIFPETINSTLGTKNIFQLRVADWVNEADSTWADITIDDLLMMRGQHYTRTTYDYPSDETVTDTNVNFFYKKTAAQKLSFVLNHGTHKPPSSQDGFVYFTANYFLASHIAELAVRKTLNKTFDQLHQTLVCEPLGLSKIYCGSTLKTLDQEKEVFGGYGSTSTPYDEGAFMRFYVDSDEGKINGKRVVSRTFFRRQLPIDPSFHGSPTNFFGARPANNITVFPEEYYSYGSFNSLKLSFRVPYFTGYSGKRFVPVRNTNKKKAWGMTWEQSNFNFKDYNALKFLEDHIGSSDVYYRSPA